jgi:hypothetical protein
MSAFLKLTSKDTLRHRRLSVRGPPPPHTHTQIRVYSILIHTGKGGQEGELTTAKVRGAMLHKAGRKF